MGALRHVGVSRPRVDGAGRVTGATRYAADEPRPGLLHARIVACPYAHARVAGIDKRAAEALPGVVAVLTAGDLPISGSADDRQFEPLARREAVFAGQPVALVVARTETIAEDARGPGRAGPRAARAGGRRPGRAAGGRATGTPRARGIRRHRNVFDRSGSGAATPRPRSRSCDVVVGGTFRAAGRTRRYLEPHAATAWPEPDGSLSVVDRHAIHVRRPATSSPPSSACRPRSVRVTAAPLGGAFGSKQLVIEPLVAGAALRLRDGRSASC